MMTEKSHVCMCVCVCMHAHTLKCAVLWVLENVYTNQSTIASYFFLNASHPFNVHVCNSNCVVEEPIVDVNVIR